MLSATNIGVKFGPAHLLAHVEMHIGAGELVALLGENGAGKSTLLKVLAGDLRPQTGVVRMNERPLYLWSMRDRAKVRSVLVQDQQAPLGFSVLETVLFGRYPHALGYPGPDDMSIARAALVATGAEHLVDRFATSLSGGEKARVLLAKTLAQIWAPWKSESRYLLLDEPTANLDPAHQHYALNCVRSFAHSEGVGVCAVLHDLNLASQYADRVILLKQGRVMASGTPREVLTAQRLSACFQVEAIVLPHPRLDIPLVVTAG